MQVNIHHNLKLWIAQKCSKRKSYFLVVKTIEDDIVFE
jgi:hypothetical protein